MLQTQELRQPADVIIRSILQQRVSQLDHLAASQGIWRHTPDPEGGGLSCPSDHTYRAWQHPGGVEAEIAGGKEGCGQ